MIFLLNYIIILSLGEERQKLEHAALATSREHAELSQVARSEAAQLGIQLEQHEGAVGKLNTEVTLLRERNESLQVNLKSIYILV